MEVAPQQPAASLPDQQGSSVFSIWVGPRPVSRVPQVVRRAKQPQGQDRRPQLKQPRKLRVLSCLLLDGLPLW
jgi:hypothetical protein